MITRNELNIFYENLFNFNISNVLKLFNDYNNNGKNLIQILTQIMFSLRNMIVDYYINNSSIIYDIDLMQDFVNLINENLFDIKKNGSPKVFIEMLLIKYIKQHDNSSKKPQKEVISEKDISNEVKSSENSIISKEKLIEKNISQDKEKIISQEEDDKIISREIIYDSFPIKNIDEIMNVRVNNIMAQANKELLKLEIKNFELLNDYAFDQEIGYLVCSLLDSKIRAASEDGIILSYEYESAVKQNLINLHKIIDVYNKITNSNKSIAIITDDYWNEQKNKYIVALKEGKKYQILEEPEEILEEINNNDIIGSSAMDLFGDIVEVE